MSLLTGLLGNIWADLIASLILLMLGILVAKIPKSITKSKAKKFFGKDILGDNFKVVQGYYSQLDADEPLNNKNQPRCKKHFHDGKIIKLRGPKDFTGLSDIRAVAYIYQELSKHRKELIDLITDKEAYKNLNNTYITIGGPMSNELTRYALSDKNNRFIDFTIPEDLSKMTNEFTVKGEVKSYLKTKENDYAIILKIKNSRSENHFFFICAGLGGSGTAASAWYLAEKWKSLYKRFHNKEFIVLLRVSPDSDTSGIEEFSQY